MMFVQAWDREGVDFAVRAGVVSRLSARDLWERAPERCDAGNGQRLAPLQLAPDDLVISAVEAMDGGWRVSFGAAGVATYSFEDLVPDLAPRRGRRAATPWLAPPAESRISFDHAEIMAGGETLRAALTHFAKYGWFHVTGAPAEPGELERFILAFGRIRETNYGRLFDVVVKPAAENLAYTDLGLEAHTDNPYRQPVPGVQVLHCLQAGAEGGENRLVDGFGVAEALRRDDPEAFAILSRTPVRFAWSDGETFLSDEAPVIGLDAAGEVRSLRYNHRSFRAIAAADAVLRDAWRDAYAKLAALVNAPDVGVELKLQAGELLVMDNGRLLHARLAFKSAPAAVRHLQGAYADHDGVYSTLARLNRAEADRRVAEVEALFASPAMDDGYGERISIREHMLQGGELAARRGLGIELAAAALLHDIGWGPHAQGAAHEAFAADFLEPRLGRAVSEPIRLHVAAKRYLVARALAYAERLSQASIDTLARQGGPFTPAEADAFEALPEFEAALALRRIDDDAKLVDAVTRPFSDYRAMLTHLALVELER
jgi:gamma-butyrobetaine dioxygenase